MDRKKNLFKSEHVFGSNIESVAAFAAHIRVLFVSESISWLICWLYVEGKQ